MEPTKIPTFTHEDLLRITATENMLSARLGKKYENKYKEPRYIPNAALASYVDHTTLGSKVTLKEVKRVTQEAVEYGFASVCIPPSFVEYASGELGNLAPFVCTVISFPHGNDLTATKVYAAARAADGGASEIDVVINIGAVLNGQWDLVHDDLAQVVRAVPNLDVKVIIETSFLSKEQKIAAALLARSVGAAYVKTSTGTSSAGATVYDVALLRTVVGNRMGVKASGGIKTKKFAQELLLSGATRLGIATAKPNDPFSAQ